MKGLLLCVFACATSAAPLLADEADIKGKISVELNALQTADDACMLTFLITSGLSQQVERVVYETVLFDKAGQVNRLTLFDFGTLPPARPRVRQFAVPQLPCAQLGRVLFNGANTCEGEGVAPDVCSSGLLTSSRTEVEVLG